MNKCVKINFFIILYYTQLFLEKELCNSNKSRNDEIVKHINDALIEWEKDIDRKKVTKNENLNKIVDIVEKIFDFNKQQKSKGLLSDLAGVTKFFDHSNLKILTPKQMFQKLPIVFAQVKAVNTSESLLNEIRQIIYFCIKKKKKVLKKYTLI